MSQHTGKRSALRLLGALLFLAAAAPAQEQAQQVEQRLRLDAGFDLRLRQEAYDNVPIIADPPGITRGGENNYFRIRSRYWGSAEYGGFGILGRLTHEFRHFLEPDDASDWEWPDEAVVDQLYLEGRGLLDGRLDFRVGRQDLVYGAGRVLLEGTPKDGARTIYFDAVKLTWHPGPKSSVDLLGIYNRPEAELTIGSLDRDLTGLDGYDNDMTESGGGIYARIDEIERLPLELYYLFKNESRWDSFTPGPDPRPVVKPGRETHTVGFRVLPVLNDQISFEFEGAAQFGETDDDRDIGGYLGYGGATWTLPVTLAGGRPRLTAGCYYLSGDDPGTPGKDEGWNPLWARYAQFSELYAYAFDAEKGAYWSNIVYPSLSASLDFDRLHTIGLSAGMLMAPEKNGPGGGNLRGYFFTACYDFPLFRNIIARRDVLYGHLLAELLNPRDYYKVDDMAYFLRWEMSYRF
jgi:hypothetical protein